MGNILIIIGLVLILAAVILWFFYRSKPLKYVPPEVKGEAVLNTSYTTRELSRSTVKTVEEDATMPMQDDMLQDETVPDLSAYDDATVPMFSHGAMSQHPSADDETVTSMQP